MDTGAGFFEDDPFQLGLSFLQEDGNSPNLLENPTDFTKVQHESPAMQVPQLGIINNNNNNNNNFLFGNGNDHRQSSETQSYPGTPSGTISDNSINNNMNMVVDSVLEEGSLSVTVGGLPDKNRVETQMGLTVAISGVTARAREFSLALPAELLSDVGREAMFGQTPAGRTLLQVKARVVSASTGEEMEACPKCVQREIALLEKRRAQRKKPTGDAPFAVAPLLNSKRILLFCGEPRVLISPNSPVILPIRIVCYSRHHSCPEGYPGYKVELTLVDPETGLVVGGPATSGAVVLTDSHKGDKRGADQQDLVPASVPGSAGGQASDAAGGAGGGHEMPVKMQKVEPAAHHKPHNSHHASSVASHSGQGVSWAGAPPAAVEPAKVGEVIPHEGPVRGGVEICVLGTGFGPTSTVRFATSAASTRFVSGSSLVCILPPASCPGVVDVEVIGGAQDRVVSFIYRDDTTETMLKLALQVLNLRLAGVAEQDPASLARALVDGAALGASNTSLSSGAGAGAGGGGGQQRAGGPTASLKNQAESYALALQAEVTRLVQAPRSELETSLIGAFELARSMPSAPGPLDLSSVVSDSRQTLTHLAAVLGLPSIAQWLVLHGADPDSVDRGGHTPRTLAQALHPDQISEWERVLSAMPLPLPSPPAFSPPAATPPAWPSTSTSSSGAAYLDNTPEATSSTAQLHHLREASPCELEASITPMLNAFFNPEDDRIVQDELHEPSELDQAHLATFKPARNHTYAAPASKPGSMTIGEQPLQQQDHVIIDIHPDKGDKALAAKSSKRAAADNKIVEAEGEEQPYRSLYPISFSKADAHSPGGGLRLDDRIIAGSVTAGHGISINNHGGGGGGGGGSSSMLTIPVIAKGKQKSVSFDTEGSEDHSAIEADELLESQFDGKISKAGRRTRRRTALSDSRQGTGTRQIPAIAIFGIAAVICLLVILGGIFIAKRTGGPGPHGKEHNSGKPDGVLPPKGVPQGGPDGHRGHSQPSSFLSLLFG
jgi:hypothetical protein